MFLCRGPTHPGFSHVHPPCVRRNWTGHVAAFTVEIGKLLHMGTTHKVHLRDDQDLNRAISKQFHNKHLQIPATLAHRQFCLRPNNRLWSAGKRESRPGWDGIWRFWRHREHGRRGFVERLEPLSSLSRAARSSLRPMYCSKALQCCTLQRSTCLRR